jgi:hypothetical protein
MFKLSVTWLARWPLSISSTMMFLVPSDNSLACFAIVVEINSAAFLDRHRDPESFLLLWKCSYSPLTTNWHVKMHRKRNRYVFICALRNKLSRPLKKLTHLWIYSVYRINLQSIGALAKYLSIPVNSLAYNTLIIGSFFFKQRTILMTIQRIVTRDFFKNLWIM